MKATITHGREESPKTTFQICTCGHPGGFHGESLENRKSYLGMCFFQIKQNGQIVEDCNCERFAVGAHV